MVFPWNIRSSSGLGVHINICIQQFYSEWWDSNVENLGTTLMKGVSLAFHGINALTLNWALWLEW